MAATLNSHWGYAVPLDGDYDGAGKERPPRRTRNDRYGSVDSQTPSLKEKKSNVSRRPSNLEQYDGAATATDYTARSRRPSTSAQNGLVGKKRSHNALRAASRPQQQQQQEQVVTSDDGSQWIHRDKLAQIESRELEEAGYAPRQPRRSGSAGPGASRAGSRSESRSGKRSRAASRDRASLRSEEDAYERAYESNGNGAPNGRKRVSTIPAADEEEQEQERAYDPVTDHELRTPEEVAADFRQQQQQQYQTQTPHTIRPSTSRLPISKNSPAPISQGIVERDSPVPRSRNGSGAISANWGAEMARKRRSRSQSIGSGVVLMDENDGYTHTPSRSRPGSSYAPTSGAFASSPIMGAENEMPTSPPRKTARTPSKATPLSGARKTTNNSTPNNPSAPSTTRTPSTTTKPQPGARARSSGQHTRVSTSGTRPNSSYGAAAHGSVNSHTRGRPSTGSINRPEGDAPWLKTMYKPDPRLPQEEQMLPTHAKRLALERGEQLPLDPADFEDERAGGAWPLAGELPRKGSASPVKADRTGSLARSVEKGREGSVASGAGGGAGYRITPTITTPPVLTPQPQPPQGKTMGVPQLDNEKVSGLDGGAAGAGVKRMPDVGEDRGEKKKKGCGCCVVM